MAAQKLLDCNQDPNNMGAVCSQKNFIDSMFKDLYRGQMVGLMHKIIEALCEPDNDCSRYTKRVKNLKHKMDNIRDLTNSWPDMTRVCHNTKEPLCVFLRKVFDVMCDCSDELGVKEILCMCTYVSDVCMSLVLKNEKTVIDEIVEMMVNYILDQNMIACRDFLFWLDHL